MKVYLQYWEESERGWGIRPDGCSLHIDSENHSEYVDMIYRYRTLDQDVPYEYDRVVGGPILVEVSETIHQNLSSKKTIRLSEVETNNLIKLREIITKHDLN